MARETPLPFSPPTIGDEEIAAVVDVLRSGWISTGPQVKAFEEEFARFVGAPAAAALNSGTAAMHVALAALGIGPGDAVITSPMTFCSTVQVIEHVGALPVFVDVDPVSLNLDSGLLERVVADHLGGPQRDRRLTAILPVHYGGHPYDKSTVGRVAHEHGLRVVEDAAHALPAKIGEEMVGHVRRGEARAVCFSFYATKNLTTGEGGMVTGSADLIEEVRAFSLHGMSHGAWRRYDTDESWRYDVDRLGFKYNMPDIQAALGRAQLRKLAGFHRRRAEIARTYTEAFRGYEELEPPVEAHGTTHAWHLYVLRLHLERLALSRDRFINELRARNVGCSVHFIPVHMHSYYRDRYGFVPDDFPVAHREFHRIVSLPIYPGMSDDDAADVIEAVIDVVKRFRQ